jgi:hypothetical protein
VNQAETEATTVRRRKPRLISLSHLRAVSRRGGDPDGEDDRWGCRREGGRGARPACVEEAGAEPEGDRELPRGGDLRRAARVQHGRRRGGQPSPLPRSVHVAASPPPHRFIACFAVPSPVIP